MEKILEFKGITKTFPGVKALDDINLDLYKGEVHVILGENGAGKSTLMKILAGAYTPDSGEVILDGNKKMERYSPILSEEAGIRMIYQELNLIPELSIQDNIFLGHELKKGVFLDRKKMYKHTKQLLQSLNIDENPRKLVKDLSIAYQQMIEIVRALSSDAKVLVFDEKRLSLGEFKQILDENYASREDLRQYIIRRLPKYGTNNPILNRFSAKILADIAKIAGQTNARGGKYLPAFYPHEIYRPLGQKLGATPDGRKAHTPLSRGASPSEFIEIHNPADIIRSLGAIDFTDYADSFCTELTLPRMGGERGITVITALIESFLEMKGSSLQFNMLNRDMLIEAQKNPAEHADIIVRVCGYSAYFIHLSRDTQDEIIARAIRSGT